MFYKSKKLVALFSLLLLYSVACGKQEHHENQIHQAQQSSNNIPLNQ